MSGSRSSSPFLLYFHQVGSTAESDLKCDMYSQFWPGALLSRPDTPPPGTELDDERNRRDGEGLARPQHHNPNPPRDRDRRARTARPISASAHPSRNRVRSCFRGEDDHSFTLLLIEGKKKNETRRGTTPRARNDNIPTAIEFSAFEAAKAPADRARQFASIENRRPPNERSVGRST